MNAVEFRAKVLAVDVPIGDNSFETAYAEMLAELLGDIDNNTRDADDEKVEELINHWIEHFSDRAYRTLADSVNKSYSHTVGRVSDQAHARAYFDLVDKLKAYRDYGLFDFRLTYMPTRP